MSIITDSDVFAKICEYALQTPNTSHYNDEGTICVDIKEDTMQSCIDFVHESYPQIEDERIIFLVNNKEINPN